MKFLWWLRLTGTVIPTIWWQIALLLIYTSGIVCLEYYVDTLYKPFPNDLILIIGTVIGLFLTFHTHAAYERYWECRELLTTFTQETKKLSRAIWLGVKEVDAKDLVEKKSALNLCLAFPVSVKHHLRKEYSYEYEDYGGLVDHLPKFFTHSSSNVIIQDEEKAYRNDYQPHTGSTPTNIPLEISNYIVSYIKYIDENHSADLWELATMQDSVTSLVDCIGGFDRILRAPIPLAYSIHLHECVWLFLLALPYQLIGSVGPWFSIPIVGIAGYCYLGILAIGFLIENPFEHDYDVPLDNFCDEIQLEIHKLLSVDPIVANTWLNSPDNRPFGPMCSYTATQLANLPMHEVREILQTVAQTVIINESPSSRRGRRQKSIGRNSSLHGYQAM